ncbi:twin-arginine translocation signal domain-containing protein, partial [Streptomyces sp. 4503]|nr:twin-arginine translocation signal domain-containing protein [Streptomyces niphimycinicus]
MTSLNRRSFMGGCAAATLLAVTGTTVARAATGTTAPTTASDEAALQAAISDL